MGMLMHHTWLNQQKEKKAEKPNVPAEKPVEKEEPAEEPVKRGRRKITK